MPTVPVGVAFAPFGSVSITVTFTVVGCPVTTPAGVSTTVVEVGRVVTVRLNAVAVLPV